MIHEQNQVNKIGIIPPAATQPKRIFPPNSGVGFNDELRRASDSGELKFSRHAVGRLIKRGISLSKTQLGKLQEAVNRAESKGSRDSLVLLNDLAFVVSIKSKTVLTAMQIGKMKESVFTNIDSTVIA